MKSLPDRVCDYVILVEYDPESPKSTTIQSRFPFQDHEDAPFPEIAIEFCFPYGDSYLPSRSKPLSHSFVSTQKDGRKVFGVVLSFFEKRPRALCLTSHWPFFSNFSAFLRALYNRTVLGEQSMKDEVLFEEYEIPVERVISNFIYEVPVPPFGKILVNANPFSGLRLTFCRSPLNKMEFLNFDFFTLFERLSPNNLLVLISAALKEARIIFLSDNVADLTNAAETLCVLLNPLEWQHIYIPVLPDYYIDTLNAPMPYICGILKEKMNDKLTFKNAIVVDLTCNTVTRTSDLKLKPIPDLMIRGLYKFLRKTMDNKNTKKKSIKCEIYREMPEENKTEKLELLIRQNFLMFFVRLLKGFEKSFVYDHGKQTYIREKFVKNLKPGVYEFYREFLSTQMFTCFVERFQEGINNLGKLDTKILYFNEVNRSLYSPSDFLSNTSSDHEREYNCPNPDKIGLSIISINIQHHCFPEFNPEFVKPPRSIDRLTKESERHLSEINFVDVETDQYLLKKYVCLKHAYVFERINNRLDLAFNNFSDQFHEDLKFNLGVRREMMALSRNFNHKCESGTTLDELNDLFCKRENDRIKAQFHLALVRQSFEWDMIFSLVKPGFVLEGEMDILKHLKEVAEETKISLGLEQTKLFLRSVASGIFESSSNTTTHPKNSRKTSIEKISTIANKESKEIKLRLLSDWFDKALKDISSKSHSFNNSRLKSLKATIQSIALSQKAYHEMEIKQINKFLASLNEFDQIKEIGVFSPENNQILQKVYNSRNMLDIQIKQICQKQVAENAPELGTVAQRDDDFIAEMNSLFSFRFWDDKGILKINELVQYCQSDAETCKKILNMLKTPVQVHVKLFDRITAEYKKSKKIIGISDSFSDLFSRFFLQISEIFEKFAKFLALSVADLESKLEKLQTAVDVVSKNVKDLEKELAAKTKAVAATKESAAAGQKGLARTLNRAKFAAEAIKDTAYARTAEALGEASQHYRAHRDALEASSRLGAELKKEKTQLRLLHMNLKLLYASSMGLLQDCEKERYLAVKKSCTKGYKLATTFTFEYVSALKALRNSFETKFSAEKVQRRFSAFMRGSDKSDNSRNEYIASLAIFSPATIIHQSELRETFLTKDLDTIRTWLSSLAEVQIGCFQSCNTVSATDFKFFSDSGQSLNAAFGGLFRETLEAIRIIGFAGQRLEEIIERFDATGKAFTKKHLRERNKIVLFFENYDMLCTLMERGRGKGKGRTKSLLSRNNNENNLMKNVSVEMQQKVSESKIPKKKKNYLNKILKCEEIFVKEVRLAVIEFVDVLIEKLEQIEAVFHPEKAEEISRKDDMDFLFDKWATNERPPDIVLDYLAQKHIKSGLLKSTTQLEKSEQTDLRLSRTENYKDREKELGDDEAISFFDYLSSAKRKT